MPSFRPKSFKLTLRADDGCKPDIELPVLAYHIVQAGVQTHVCIQSDDLRDCGSEFKQYSDFKIAITDVNDESASKQETMKRLRNYNEL